MTARAVVERLPETARSAARDLYPGYFALVMATGISSTVLHGLGHPRLSGLLLLLSVVCGLVLLALLVVRAVAFREQLVQDLSAPDRTFAFFTLVAALNVVGVRLVLDGRAGVAAGLLAASVAVWVPLSYGIPARLVLSTRRAPVLAGVNGTWFIWVVGTQSLAVAAAALEAAASERHAAPLAVAAFLLWSVGVVLYLIVAALVLIRLLLLEVTAADLNPPYWIAMGATAITVLAAARLLDAPDTPIAVATRPALLGLAVMLWAFGTWLIPMLVLFSVWRHVTAHGPLRYGPPLWSVVFPLGMYSAASSALGTVADLPLIASVGQWFGWVAVATWAVVFAAMLHHLARQLRPLGRRRVLRP